MKGEPHTPCAFGCCNCPTLLPCTPEPGSWLRDLTDAAEQRGYERAMQVQADTARRTLT